MFPNRRSNQCVAPASEGRSGTRDYMVLYYKRKNKVHKSKGVSKMDGILSISSFGSVSSKVTLHAMGEEGTTIKGAVVTTKNDKDLAQQSFTPDDLFALGPYEVEIL